MTMVGVDDSSLQPDSHPKSHSSNDFYDDNGTIIPRAVLLTFSPPILLRLYTLPYWSNPSF